LKIGTNPNTRTLCLLAALALAGAGVQARADLIANQLPSDLGSGVYSQYATGSNTTRAADDFWTGTGMPNGSTFSLARVQAQVWSQIGTNPNNYWMELYADDQGLPGAFVSLAPATNAWLTGSSRFGYGLTQLVFELGWTLPANQRYWISVVGLTGQPGAVMWATHEYGSAAINAPAAYRRGGNAWAPVNPGFDRNANNLAFSVEGAVLVPGAGAGSVVLLAGASVMRRRRR
jgi:hypothetical protein